MDTKEIMKIATKMAIELLKKTESPADAMLIIFKVQDIIKLVSKKNLENIKAAERIREKTTQRQTRKET